MEKRGAILSGLGGGLLFGAMQSFTVGPARGVFMGVLFAAGVTWFLRRFASSDSIQEQIAPAEDDLLPGEEVLVTRPANLVVVPKALGLDGFAFDGWLWAVGMKDRESLGGAVHLTNYRLLFKTHRYNRLRGKVSIFLPTIRDLENRSVLIFHKMAVVTGASRVELVVHGADALIARICHARGVLDDGARDRLRRLVADHPERCADALESWEAANRVNRVLNMGMKTSGAAGAAVNPIGALGSRFVGELLDRAVREPWQGVFEAAGDRRAGAAPVVRSPAVTPGS